MRKLAIATVVAAALSAIAPLSAAAQSAHPSHVAKATGQLDMDAVPSLGPEKIKQLQQALEEKGFDPGPADGVLGARTKQAVRDFQYRYGIEASGDVDNQTLYALGAWELAGQSGGEPNQQ